MPFRCIMHVEKHNVIAEGRGTNRFAALEAASRSAVAQCMFNSGALDNIHAANHDLLHALREIPPGDCLPYWHPTSVSYLFERCDATLT